MEIEKEFNSCNARTGGSSRRTKETGKNIENA